MNNTGPSAEPIPAPRQLAAKQALVAGRKRERSTRDWLQGLVGGKPGPAASEKPGMQKLVLCAGMMRSGSTWLFNVLRYCYMNAGYKTYGAHAANYDPTVPAYVHILKVHRYRPEYHAAADYVFSTYRDVRDAVASKMRRNLIKHTTGAAVKAALEMINEECLPWHPHANLELCYEDLIKDKVAVVEAVIRTLGLQGVNATEVHRDVEKLRMAALGEYDKTTLLWPDHVTDGRVGSFEGTLSPEAVRAIEEVSASWLKEHGYAVPAPERRGLSSKGSA